MEEKPTTYELARRQFIEKSKRRRVYFDGTNPKHVAARRERRRRGGAFGKAVAAKALALGTIRGEL